MGFTVEQNDAIKSRGETLLVSAAAGSGKTSVLVERVKRLVLTDGVSLENMLIVTFTDAAASELRSKLSAALNSVLSDPSLSRARADFLRSQISLLERANISTFHRFAMEVIRRYYHVIGVSPELKVIDEGSRSLMMNEAADELFSSKFESGDKDFTDFLDTYCSYKSIDNLRRMLFDVKSFTDSLPDPHAWLKGLANGELFDSSVYLEYASQRALSCLYLAKKYLDADKEVLKDVPVIRAKLALAESGIDSAIERFEAGRFEDGFTAISQIEFARMVASKAEKPVYELLKERSSELVKKAKENSSGLVKTYGVLSAKEIERQQKVIEPYIRILCELALDFDGRYAEKKSAGGYMDFADMEHFALRILSDEDAASEYRTKFDYIFIDEYQDSNRVQDELISRIARPDNLFMVGDVKQSIYKFRQAEPEIFLGKYYGFKNNKTEAARALDLNANFRSKAGVIDFVNELFSKIMTPESSSMVYDEDAALHEGAPYSGNCVYRTQLRITETKIEDGSELDQDILDMKGAELEALDAVNIISENLGKTIYDSKAGAERPLRFRDFAILLRKVKDLGEIYYETLSRAGIPVYLERSEGYFDAPEVSLTLSLLRIIDNIRRDEDLISVLRFPAIGFSTEELAQIRIYANTIEKNIPYYRAFRLYAQEGPDENLASKSSDFLGRIDVWKKAAMHIPLGDLVWRVLCESGIMAFAAAMPEGEQRTANLRALADRAEGYEASDKQGLFGFVNYIEAINAKNSKVKTGQAGTVSENADAVRIMTVHKSKGLEFPVVILGCANGPIFGKGGSESGLINYHRDFGISLRAVNKDESLYALPLSFRIIDQQNKREEFAEAIRLFYVAATRPKDQLFITASLPDWEEYRQRRENIIEGDFASCASFLDLMMFCPGCCDISVNGRRAASGKISERAEALKDQLQNGFELDASELPVSEEEISLRFNYELCAEDSQKLKYSVSQLAEMERLGLDEAPKKLAAEGEEYETYAYESEKRRIPAFIAGDTKLGAAEKGTAYHKVMKEFPFDSEDKSPDAIRALMDGMLDRNLLSEAEYRAVDPGKIAAFFSCDTGRRASAAEKLFKEESFTLKKQFNGKNILVQGTIDCCFEEDGSWVLVDYKSNYVDKEDRAEALERLRLNYLPQVKLYAQALESISGKPVSKAVLYLFSSGEELEIELN